MPNSINWRSEGSVLQDGPIVQIIFARRPGAASGGHGDCRPEEVSVMMTIRRDIVASQCQKLAKLLLLFLAQIFLAEDEHCPK